MAQDAKHSVAEVAGHRANHLSLHSSMIRAGQILSDNNLRLIE